MSKSALEAIVDCYAARFFSHNVTINEILPGPTNTDLFAELNHSGSERRASYVARIPVGRICEPEGIAEIFLYLVSERAAYVTRQKIAVAGGPKNFYLLEINVLRRTVSLITPSHPLRSVDIGIRFDI